MANGLVPRFPAPTSAAVGGVLEGLFRGLTLQQSLVEAERRRRRFGLEEAGAERQRRLDELRLGEAEAQAEERRLLPQDLARLFAQGGGGPGLAPTAVPGLPGGQGAAFTPPDLPEAGGPSLLPGTRTPGLLGPGQLQAEVGPEAMTRLLKSPSGREALKLRGLVPEDEFRRRQGLEAGRKQFDIELKESADLALRGDAAGSELALSKAYRAIAPHLSEDKSFEMLERAAQSQRRVATLFRSEEERQKAGRDRQKLARAQLTYLEDPSPEHFSALTTALVTPESEFGQEKSDEAVRALAVGTFKSKFESAPLSKIHRRVGELLQAQRERGQKLDDEQAWLQALSEDPGGAGAYLDRAVQGQKVPAAVSKFFFGDERVPKTEMELAIDLTKQGDSGRPGLQPGQPGFSERVKQHLTDLKRAARPNETLNGLRALRNQHVRELNTLRVQKGKLDRSDPNWTVTDAEERRLMAKIQGIDDSLREHGALPPPGRVEPPKLDPGTVRRQVDSRLDSVAKRKGFADFKDASRRDPAKAQEMLDSVNKQLTDEEKEAYQASRGR